jgi:uncharacterized RDD family membrane protein YckC
MTSTPEQGDAAGQWDGSTAQGSVPRPPSQPSAPGNEQYPGYPSGAATPGPDAGTRHDQPGRPYQSGPRYQPGQPYQAGRPHGRPVEAQTRVSGRRVFQYFIDAFLVSIIPYIVSIPFDASNSTVLHVIGGIVTFVLFVIISFWYWVIWPKGHNGQTFAMKWFGIRVVSKDGDPANTAQYAIRWIGLIIDGFPWVWPFTGLLGLFVMVVSRYRQRVGDHMARTLVISEGLTSAQAAQYGVDSRDGLASDQLPQQQRPETGL